MRIAPLNVDFKSRRTEVWKELQLPTVLPSGQLLLLHLLCVCGLPLPPPPSF
jgi:hypothetical protein